MAFNKALPHLPERLRTRALLPVAVIQALAPFFHNLHASADAIGDAGLEPILRAPEQPPGPFFAIWGLIFAAMIGFAIHAFTRHDHLSRRVAPPLAVTAILGTAWMILEQLAGASVFGFPLLLALAASAWWSAARFEQMRGLGGSAGKFLADLASGLFAGWMSVAVAISLPGLIRQIAGLAPTDAVWPLISLVLLTAILAAWAARRWITSSPWFVAALVWGLCGLVINNWTLTQLHLPALAAALAAMIITGYWLTRAAQHQGRFA